MRDYTRARGYGVDRCRHTCRSEMSNIECVRKRMHECEIILLSSYGKIPLPTSVKKNKSGSDSYPLVKFFVFKHANVEF